jgi:hypothetical protein
MKADVWRKSGSGPKAERPVLVGNIQIAVEPACPVKIGDTGHGMQDVEIGTRAENLVG